MMESLLLRLVYSSYLWGVGKLVMNLCSKNENVSFLKDEESISITAKLEPNLSHICFHLFTISLAFYKSFIMHFLRVIYYSKLLFLYESFNQFFITNVKIYPIIL